MTAHGISESMSSDLNFDSYATLYVNICYIRNRRCSFGIKVLAVSESVLLLSELFKAAEVVQLVKCTE